MVTATAPKKTRTARVEDCLGLRTLTRGRGAGAVPVIETPIREAMAWTELLCES